MYSEIIILDYLLNLKKKKKTTYARQSKCRGFSFLLVLRNRGDILYNRSLQYNFLQDKLILIRI